MSPKNPEINKEEHTPNLPENASKAIKENADRARQFFENKRASKEKGKVSELEIVNKNGKTAEGYVEDILSAVKDDQQRDAENKVKIPTEKKETNMESPIIIKGKQQPSPSGLLEQRPSGLFVPEDISLEKQKEVEDEKQQEVEARSKIEKAFGGTIDVINNYPENLNSSIDVGSFIKPETPKETPEELNEPAPVGPKKPDKPKGPKPEGPGPRSPEAAAVKPEVVEKSREQAKADLKEQPGRNPEEIAKDYEALTGKKLIEERDRIVKEHFEQRGARVMKTKEAEPIIYAREQQRVYQENRGEALRRHWNTFTPEQKKQFAVGEKLDMVKINKDFAEYTKARAEEFGVSENAVYRAMNTGLDLDSLENGNMFGFGKKMKIQLVSGGEMRFSNPEEFKTWAEGLGKAIDAKGNVIDTETRLRTDKKIIEGRKRILAERELRTKELIQETLGGKKIERPSESKVKAKPVAEQPKPAEATPEKLKDSKSENPLVVTAEKAKSTAENSENKEKSPEQVYSKAVNAVEKRDQKDPIINSKWMERAKKYLLKPAGYLLMKGVRLLALCGIVLLEGIHYTAEFTSWALKKKKMSFETGLKRGKGWFIKEKSKKEKAATAKKMLNELFPDEDQGEKAKDDKK